MNKKSFAYQAGLLALSNTALMLLAFAYRIILGRLSSTEGLGVHTLVMQVYTIMMSFCVYGLCAALTHVSASALGDKQGIRSAVRVAFSFFFILFFALGLPVIIGRDYIAREILVDYRTVSALYMVLACVLLTGIENILKAVLIGMRKVKFTAASEVGEQTLRIVFAYFVLKAFINEDNGRTALLIMLVMTLSELYSVVLLSICYYKCVIHGTKEAKKPASYYKRIKRRFIELALPSSLTCILGNVFASVTVILFPARLTLAGLSRAEAVKLLGIISGMLMPILMLPSSLISAVCILIMPGIASHVAKGDTEGSRKKIKLGIETVGLLGIPSMTLLLPFAPLLCSVVFGRAIEFNLVVLMSLECIVTYYIVLINSILNGLGRQKQVLMLTAIREAVQLALVWVLAARPELNVYGYVIGLIGGDILHVLVGFVYVRVYAKTVPSLFNGFITPCALSVVLYFCSRIIFFKAIAFGVVGAAVISLSLCAVLYILLLRIFNIRPIAYLKRVVFIKNV